MRIKIDGIFTHSIIEKIDDNNFEIIKSRKSRIIMKDSRRILEESNAIKTQFPKAKIILRTNAPLCSKSIKFLEENQINIKQLT